MTDPALILLEKKLSRLSLDSRDSVRDITLLISLTAENKSEEATRDLQDVVQTGFERFVNSFTEDKYPETGISTKMEFIRICVPHCTGEVLLKCMKLVSKSEIPLTVKLDFHSQIIRQLHPLQQHHSAIAADTLSLISANLGVALNHDDATLSKKCGQLLRLLWRNIDGDFLSTFNSVMSANFGDYPTNRYIVMCILIDSFLQSEFFFSHLWRYLVQGVQSREPMIRKQCIYMIKTTLDAFDKELLSDSNTGIMKLRSDRKKEILDTWSDYILLIESLNEKQYHIVQPNFRRLETVLKGIQEDYLHINWLLALFTRIVNHDSNQVRKYGALYILRLDLSVYKAFTQSGMLTALYTQFVVMSSVSSFFSRRPDQNEEIIPELFVAMKAYLTNVLSVLQKQEQKAEFLHGIMDTLSKSAWSPVPCMYWMAALASVDSSERGCWDSRTLKVILDMMSKNLLLCEKKIRSATQCYLLHSVLNLCEMNESTLKPLCSLIVEFRTDQILRYKSNLWSKLKLTLEQAIQGGNLHLDELLKSDSKEEFALMLLPLCVTPSDDGSCPQSLHDWLREGPIELLSTCSHRVYANRDNIFSALQTVVRIYTLTSTDTESQREKNMEMYVALCETSVVDYILSLISQKQELTDGEINTCLEFIKLVNKLSQSTEISRIVDCAITHLKSDSQCSEIEWLLLAAVLTTPTQSTADIVKTLINMGPPSDRRAPSMSQLRALWAAYYQHLSTPPPDVDWDHWYSEAKEALSIMYRDDSCVIFSCFTLILPHVDVSDVEDAAHSLLIKVEEENKNSYYLPLVTSLVQAVFTQPLIVREDCGELLSQVFVSVYSKSEERPGIANILSRQFCWVFVDMSTPTPDWMVSALVNLAMYGPIHNKAHRNVEDAFMFMQETGILTDIKLSDEIRVGWDISDHEVRVLVIDSVISKLKSGRNKATLSKLVDKICETHTGLLNVKCYNNYPNALSHRQRHRLLCLLLVLIPHIIKVDEIRSRIMAFVRSSLRIELQPSCRHQLEWIYIYILKSQPLDIHEHLINLMNPIKMAKDKALVVCSMFSIASHICAEPINLTGLTHNQLSLMVDIIPVITPWGMSSKFNMRIHAQAALMKIWQHAKEYQLEEELSKHFPILKANMEFALLSGTATEKNSRKLLENFFFFKFDAVKDWSLEVIFSLWPRLLSLAEGESIPYHVFDEETKRSVPVKCHHSELRTCDPGTWHIKVKEGDNETEMVYTDVQRKITAWRTTNPALDNPAIDPQAVSDVTHEADKPGLVLVTSLIDKLPNLGGLCRTAEIFGANEMVVSSLKITEDTNFLSTAVTSHRWVPLKQVPAYCLPEYLTEMKQYGFTVVGAEQSTNSKSLRDYHMPAKTVLVLGNEKEGIPAELLQLLDVCVEIPQQGVIRSLNVHVSGALLIWEYRKQRLLDMNSDSGS